MEHLKYPTGRFKKPEIITPVMIQDWIREIETLPAQMNDLTATLSEEQLDLTYRPGGWSIRQVVHHVFDSHTNAYVRFKWTLTEDNPTIKAYDEVKWAELADTQQTPVTVSLHLLAGLHFRWSVLMKSLSTEELGRTFFHPGSQATYDLNSMVGMYNWHGKHHLEHIKIALKGKV